MLAAFLAFPLADVATEAVSLQNRPPLAFRIEIAAEMAAALSVVRTDDPIATTSTVSFFLLLARIAIRPPSYESRAIDGRATPARNSPFCPFSALPAAKQATLVVTFSARRALPHMLRSLPLPRMKPVGEVDCRQLFHRGWFPTARSFAVSHVAK
jgi:hypothetical protein